MKGDNLVIKNKEYCMLVGKNTFISKKTCIYYVKVPMIFFHHPCFLTEENYKRTSCYYMLIYKCVTCIHILTNVHNYSGVAIKPHKLLNNMPVIEIMIFFLQSFLKDRNFHNCCIVRAIII